MPRNVYWNLRHDRISEAERWREVGQLFDGVGDDACFLEASEALRARPDMRLEGGNTETLLVIEEEVDLGGQKVTMIHERLYEVGRKWVSGK
jgi:hypothetical protein